MTKKVTMVIPVECAFIWVFHWFFIVQAFNSPLITWNKLIYLKSQWSAPTSAKDEKTQKATLIRKRFLFHVVDVWKKTNRENRPMKTSWRFYTTKRIRFRTVLNGSLHSYYLHVCCSCLTILSVSETGMHAVAVLVNTELTSKQAKL